MNYPQVLKLLLRDQPASLADWLAVPLPADQARAALPDVQQRLLSGRGHPRAPFNVRLGEIIVRYWAGHDVEADVKNFAAVRHEPRQQALLALGYGQLLMARRLAVAWKYLDHGFELATHLLEPEDYFEVLKRHELLRQLPLSTRPAPAESLESLLDEAQIIARLRGAVRRNRDLAAGHRDTVG